MLSNNYLEEFEKVYSLLSDETSKEIYLARINYIISHDKRIIDSVVEKYLPGLSVRNNLDINDLLLSIPNDNPIVLYGAGVDLSMHINEFLLDSRVVALCDRDKHGKTLYGLPVISPDQLISDPQYSVIITSHVALKSIKDFLLEHQYPDNLIYEMAPYVFCADNGQYFDVDFLEYDNVNGEVFVDAGCCDLQSTLLFHKYCKNIKKVYAFEPDKKNYEECKKVMEENNLLNVTLLQKGTWSSSGRLSFSERNDGSSRISDEGDSFIDVTAIDDIISSDDRVTFIKMDVEGAEMESLKGASECIKRYRPKLAICIYHKPEDMYRIPLYIKELVSEYRLYIRHHSNMDGETVLYATI